MTDQQAATSQPRIDISTTGPTPARVAWITPAVHAIEAGEAEVGTRTRADGAFTSS